MIDINLAWRVHLTSKKELVSKQIQQFEVTCRFHRFEVEQAEQKLSVLRDELLVIDQAIMKADDHG